VTTSVTVRHNFETAHRLPHLGGKCRNLHGHSWWVEVTVTGHRDPAGILVDFGTLKHDLRYWVDTHLDHGAMLGADDPLLPALEADGSKLYVFDGTGLTLGLEWPTVENVAELLRRAAMSLVADRPNWHDVSVTRVRVTETHVNAAEVTP
jgi:6-pyruvoyl tetrahydropterin synthase/QueD family protein